MELPKKPGVYMMLDKSGEIIYVGKAKILRNRVSSYFSGSHDAKTTALVANIDRFNVIIAGSEFDALVLENNLIKQHRPKYNILLKDDKGYPYIRLDSKSAYPRFTIVSGRKSDGARYFGPFKSRGFSREAIDTVSKALLLPTCSRKFPQDIGKDRPCLNHHIGACRGYCLPDTPKSDYDAAMTQAVMIFEGRSADLKRALEAEMEKAAEALRFEAAAELRDKIRALDMLEKKQTAISSGLADTDVVGFFRGPAKSCFVVLHYIGGKLLAKEYELLENPHDDDAEAVSSVVRQYYDLRDVYPKTICLPCEIEDMDALEKLFTERAGSRVSLTVPQRGDKLLLVKNAIDNAKEETERASSKEEKVRKTLQWLETALALPAPPRRIEAYDISNLGNTDIVASMTVFVDGRPLKRDYRKFRIKTTDGQDDLGSMREVLTRRFRRYLDGDPSFGSMPDLLLIDGGSVHAKTAVDALAALGIEAPTFGMVKDDRHRTRALTAPDGSEIGMGAVPAVFALIGTIQEETHRFAIEYQRSLRSKKIGSSLDEIKGVGEKRRNELLAHFKSIKNIRAASLEELAQVVPKNTAQAVRDHFAKSEEEE